VVAVELSSVRRSAAVLLVVVLAFALVPSLEEGSAPTQPTTQARRLFQQSLLS
jgi:hypothetical protein